MADHEKQTERRQQLTQEAAQFLEGLGLTPDTPGLDWGDGPSPENLAKLYASAAQIVAARAGQAAETGAQQTEEQLREARIAALNEAGVTRTSVATTGATAPPNPIAGIKDTTTLLNMGMEQELARARERRAPRG